MRIALLDRTHASEIAALMNRTCDLEHHRFTPSLVRRRLWDYPHNVPAARLGAFDADRLVAVVSGGLKGEQGLVRIFAVDEAHRRQGLAGRMLARVETVLAERGAREITALYGSPGYFMPGLDPRYTAALCLLQRRGYERTNVVINMAVGLNGSRRFAPLADRAEHRILRRGVCLRRAEPTDRPRLQTWMRRHFPGGWETEVDLTFALRPIPTWIAIRNSGVVGFAIYDVEMFPGGFGPTGVDASLRGSGVGGALMLRTLADMQDRGYVECEIAWVGPIAFYAKVCGARINRSFWHLRKPVS